MRFPTFHSLVNILFPLQCIGCSKPGVALCGTCISRIPHAQDLPAKTYAVFDYGNPIIRKAIRNLKYHRRSEATRALCLHASAYIGEYLSEHLQSSSTTRVTLVPIPSYRSRSQERGFNQSTLIAQWFSEGLVGSRVIPLLTKTRATLPQARLTRRKRLTNLADSMLCTEPLNPKELYLIIDDVITTGATCEEAQRALRTAGARKICSIALAHGYVRI